MKTTSYIFFSLVYGLLRNLLVVSIYMHLQLKSWKFGILGVSEIWKLPIDYSKKIEAYVVSYVTQATIFINQIVEIV